jgi:hypothetical protein
MPTKNPHVYASRSVADLQQANPANPNFKAKPANKKPSKTHSVVEKFKKLAKSRSSKAVY